MDAVEYELMDAVEDRMWWYRAMHGHALRALEGLPTAARILDAGCGTGGFLAKLRSAHPGAELFGLEYAEAAALRAASKAGAHVAAGTINALPFPDAHFDAVVSLDVLCHAAVDEPSALAEFRRVLRPGGRLVLNLPAHEWLRSAHDLRVHTARRYDRARAAAVLGAAGFEQAEPRHWNSLLLPLMVLQRKVLKRDEGDSSDVAPFPPWLDASLFTVCRLEAALLGAGLRFPAGGSVLATATRPLDPAHP
ncbi:class I SAM-dependent methyltransferase [Roseococcus sp. SDR]|uniref:class I SAM-dependent methyltransferase n=1 Tax=Roseococcus sp. SDR TaxID=2835532 RepID=UPI001BCF9D11|nr:class I SAM-dependent methyltransferase [Roseococcus sp. SDR]MBS7789580.1 class I SAM-dependent methyltransferase [Roseococcus sp. SDR]MBV1844894.1 class I SAM-dependent methyltransferase [Roseococcus sp. SDR]